VFVVLKGPRRGLQLSAEGLDEILDGARRRAGLAHATYRRAVLATALTPPLRGFDFTAAGLWTPAGFGTPRYRPRSATTQRRVAADDQVARIEMCRVGPRNRAVLCPGPPT
jgi:hypothetical protein